MKVDLTLARDLPIFFGCEQPETCRKCGVRTDFDELPDGTQLHQCLHCANRYIVEFDGTFEY